eukprot:1947204-Prymnesium_polylepis.1
MLARTLCLNAVSVLRAAGDTYWCTGAVIGASRFQGARQHPGEHRSRRLVSNHVGPLRRGGAQILNIIVGRQLDAQGDSTLFYRLDKNAAGDSACSYTMLRGTLTAPNEAKAVFCWHRLYTTDLGTGRNA